MKVRSDKDTTTKFQKIKLLESFGFSSSYNLLADSMNLQNISFSARTTLLEKVNIDASGSLDPYAIDSKGARYNKFQVKNNGQLARLVNFRVGVGVSLKSSTKEKSSSGSSGTMRMAGDDSFGGSFGESGAIGFENQPEVDFSIPWNLRLDYSYNYSKPAFVKNITQTLSFSGDLSLTQNWKIGFNSGFDFKNRKLTTTSMNIYRDLHCWEMRISIVPIGYLKSYSFQINVKSAILQDLKITKRDSHMNRL
jgi:hypothetical protein